MVATYRGDARVEWLDNGHTYLVPEGRTWSERDVDVAAKPTPSAKVRASRPPRQEALEPEPTPHVPTSPPPPQSPPELGEPGGRGLAEEARILSRALELLRVERSASHALEEIEQHATAFSPGGLGLEADMIRVEALMQLGRRSAALTILQEYSPAQLPAAKARLLRQLASEK